MQAILAIAWLTVRASVRFRVFFVLAALLLLAVTLLPAIIKHDGTARGFTQITLTYTLGSATVLLGFATLWFGCGSLAREIEECQLQMIDAKPAARWQVWLGKWLGIMALNTALLALCAASVYALLLWRAEQLPTQPVNQRALLFNEVLTARASAREIPGNPERDVEKLMAAARERGLPAGVNETELRRQFLQEVQAAQENVPNDTLRRWVVDLSHVRDKVERSPVQLRVRFFAAQRTASDSYAVIWEAGPLDRPRARLNTDRLAAGTFHELTVPPGLLDAQGRLTVDCVNRSGATLVLPLDGGLEVLYRESSFVVNLIRALAIILFWLGLLTAIGLATAAGLSFPVAAFVSLSLLFLGLSSESMARTLAQGAIMEADHETGEQTKTWADVVALPVLRATLKLVRLAEGFNPVEALSTGRSVTWGEVGQAFLQVTVMLTGLAGIAGIYVLTRRELANVHSRS